MANEEEILTKSEKVETEANQPGTSAAPAQETTEPKAAGSTSSSAPDSPPKVAKSAQTWQSPQTALPSSGKSRVVILVVGGLIILIGLAFLLSLL